MMPRTAPPPAPIPAPLRVFCSVFVIPAHPYIETVARIIIIAVIFLILSLLVY
jgi:hypothetical protein